MTAPADGGHLHGAETGVSVLASVPILALFVAGYAYAAVLAGQPPRSRSAGSSIGRTPRTCMVAWYAGLGVVAVALFSPLGGSHTLSAHMLQHELLLTVAPVLLVAGVDQHIALPLHRMVVAPALRTGAGRRVLALLGNPAVATALWVAVVLGWHLPAVHDATLDDGRLHLARQVSLVAAGVIFWIAVVGGPRSVAVHRRIAALGVAMASSGVLGAFLIWSNAVVYPGHAPADLWFGLTPLADQRLAGIVMMALDMPLLLGALIWVVAQWARQQPRTPASDPDVVATPLSRGA